MLTRFNNEVLSRGAGAVLPQNLNLEWLNRLQKISEEFLDSNFSLDECKDPQEAADPILSTCVYEILLNRYGDLDKVSKEEIIENMVIYAISITMEAVHREADIGLEPPDLDNIFSIERIVAYKEVNPDFIKALEQACIIRDSSNGWFGNIKKKLMS